MELDYKAIGKRIKKVRIEQHITQRELAEMVDICTSHISNIELGKKPLSLPTFIAICNALGVTADKILLENYENNEELLKKEALQYLLDGDKQQLNLTIRIAETIRSECPLFRVRSVLAEIYYYLIYEKILAFTVQCVLR